MSKLKIQLAQINPTVGDLAGNCEKIIAEFKKASDAQCDLVVFPEMIVSGYLCEDLLQKEYFIDEIEDKIRDILLLTKSSETAILLSAPIYDLGRKNQKVLRNSAILLEKGEVKQLIHKKTLPNYSVFDEKRYFENSDRVSTFEFRGQTLAVLICEDQWDAKNLYLLGEQVFDLIISLNASPYSKNKHELRQKVIGNFAKTLNKNLVYVNQVGAQDSVVFDGSSFVMNAAGEIVLQMQEFTQDSAVVEIAKSGEITIPNNHNFALTSKANRNYQACVLGLQDYVLKNGFSQVILGMSGGIDSALVAAIAVDALGAQNVTLYALPSRFNSDESMNDAVQCAQNLGVKLEVISIEMPFSAMLMTIDDISDLAKENLQSRLRGNILMTISNTTGALLLSTGNKSELATGYATLYGDMCGAFNPIKDLYKTEVYELAKNCAAIPQNIIQKAPTAELRPNQKDSDSLPDYAILDQILAKLIDEQQSVAQIINAGFAADLVQKVAKLFYQSEYKRRQSCMGPRVSEMSFDKDRRYPITNKFTK